MKGPDIVEAWKWLDPYQIIERLIGAPFAAEIVRTLHVERRRAHRDRYYTMARRVVIRRLTKGRQ